MDREAIRALNRERVRKRGGVQNAMEHRFLRRFNESTSKPHTLTHTIDPSDDDEKSDESRSESTTNRDSMDTGDVRMKDDIEHVNVEPGFDFDEFVAKLKTSPASSVKSVASWKQYGDQPVPSGAPVASEQVRKRLLESPMCQSQETILPDTVAAANTNVLQLILEAIQKLTHEQQQLTAAVNRINSTLDCLTADPNQPKQTQSHAQPFHKKYNLQLPYATLKDFVTFDNLLNKNEEFRGALIFSLVQKYDTNRSMTKNISAILRKYMTREVALLYTAQKAVSGKAIFKDTALSACLLETIDALAADKVMVPVPDSEYLANLGSVLANAKDWGVSRKDQRVRKKPRT